MICLKTAAKVQKLSDGSTFNARQFLVFLRPDTIWNMEFPENIEFPLVLTVAETRDSERFTMNGRRISSLQLMECAGMACARKIIGYVERHSIKDVRVFCGPGNNGGDGLVVARALLQHPWPNTPPAVQVALCRENDSQGTPELLANLAAWNDIAKGNDNASTLTFDGASGLNVPADALVVDALFGIGLSRPVAGIYAAAIQAINASGAVTVAIDTPSGLFSDKATPRHATVVKARYTLSVQFPKTAFFLRDNFPFCGNVTVVDVGMCPASDTPPRRFYLTREMAAGLLRQRNPFASKHDFGHGLLVAGSADMPGAAILAATAALKGGIGKVTLHTPKLAACHLPARLPEAILHPDTDERHLSRIDWDTMQHDVNAVAIGPGLGTHPQTASAVKELMDRVRDPLVLDADALNVLAANKTWLAFLPACSILTPHAKEFERLAGSCNDDFERLEKAREFALRYSIVLVLKGRYTLVSLPDGRQFFNTTGNEGMATAGSGDVLAGLLLSLRAQGYTPEAAALLAVYVHGLAGDLCKDENSSHSVTASDLPHYFGKAFRLLAEPEDEYL
jgi:ADP-dependent NAD(P)H-hydrate dehydratase / NAD(P)H-hydrate epimerase